MSLDPTQMKPTKLAPTQLAPTQLAPTQKAEHSYNQGPIPAPPPPPSIDVTNKSAAQKDLENFNANPKPKKKNNVPPTDEESEGTHLVPNDKNVEQPAFIQALSSIQVSAGLAMAFFVLIGLLWLLVPTASGYTRAQLLWFTFFGNTKLTTDASLQSQGPSPEQLNAQNDQVIPEAPQEQVSTNLLSGIDLSSLDYGE